MLDLPFDNWVTLTGEFNKYDPHQCQKAVQEITYLQLTSPIPATRCSTDVYGSAEPITGETTVTRTDAGPAVVNITLEEGRW